MTPPLLANFTKRRSLILSGILIGVVIILIVITALLSNKQRLQTGKAPNKAIVEAPAYPTVQVESWTEGEAPKAIPPSLRVYEIKQVPHDEQAANLSQKIMGTNRVEKTEKGLYISQLENAQERDLSLFIYNTGKGEYSYASTRGILLPGSDTQTLETRINSFLNTVFLDPTLKITASYKRHDKPGIVYYEVHRDWDAVGLPILNAFGILNLPEGQSLNSLTLSPKSDPIENDNIYATSDDADGLTRLTDFNTMTIGINENDNSVRSIVSNIRQIESSKLSINTILPYQDAAVRLRNNQYDFFYTAPSGDGVPSYDKVYPDNQATASQAQVSEITLAYIEEHPSASQNKLIPYYIFRGSTELSSGYRVNFVAGVSALLGGEALGAQTLAQAFDTGQKQGTFTIDDDPNAPHCGIGLSCPPTPSVSPTPRVSGCGVGLSCPPTPSVSPTPRVSGCGVGLSCPPTIHPTATPTPTPIFVTATKAPPTPTPTCTPGVNCPTTPTLRPPTSTPRPPTSTPTPTCTPGVNCPTTPTPTCTPGVNCPTTPTLRPPTSTPRPPTSTPTSTPPQQCPVTPADLSNIRSISPRLRAGQLNVDNARFQEIIRSRLFGNARNGDWFTFTTDSTSLNADDIVTSYEALVAQEGELQRPADRVITDQLTSIPECPVRTTGPSPTLFVYGYPGQLVHIEAPGNIKYADPVLYDGQWSIISNPQSNLLVNDNSRNYIYYEYQPLEFTRPSQGWTLAKAELPRIGRSIGTLLGLSNLESERLLFELNHAASSVDSDTLFVGIIDVDELNEKLPLSISGIANVKRLHFYIGAAYPQSIAPPKISPIERSIPLVLELGALAQ